MISGRRPSNDVNLSLANRASKDSFVARKNIAQKLQYRFDSILIAACTYAMKRLGRLSILLQRKGETWFPRYQLLKFIPFLLSIPPFKASHFFFKLAYSVQERRLRLSCSQEFFLKFYDRRIATGSVVNILQSLRNIESGLNGAEASEYLTGHIESLEKRIRDLENGRC